MRHPLEKGTDDIEDALFDLKTLIRFGLHMTEHSTETEFGEFKSDWCTLMYLLIDKIEQLDDANGRVDFATRELLHGVETMQ